MRWRPGAGFLLFGYGLLVVGLIWEVLDHTGGMWIYPLDDAYIHMAVARHFVEDGVWGLTPYAFSSTTSSPLFTLLIAGGFALLGVTVWIPLFLGILGGAGSVILWGKFLKQHAQRWSTLLEPLHLFVVPLPVMAVLGMEHTLHILTVIPFFALGVRWAVAGEYGKTVLILAAVSTAFRYESLFLAAAFVLLLLHARRVKDAILLVAAAWMPAVMYGLVTALHGWGFFPPTLRLKGAELTFQGVVRNLWDNLQRAPELAVLLLVLGWILHRRRRAGISIPADPLTVAALTLAVGTFLHLSLARTGWFFRYEAYLISLGLLVLGWALPELPRATRRLMLIGLIAIPFPRVLAFPLTPQAARNIHDMQIQTARFLRAFYEGETVALGDVGAPNFFADLRCVDLVGLGDIHVARLRLEGKVAELPRYVEARGVRVAIFYEKWFPELRRRWRRVGRWTIPDNLIAGDSVISFFAVDSTEYPRLRQAFLQFSRDSLPPGVRWTLDP